MFCPKCGKENPDTNQFCAVCGERTSINQEQTRDESRKMKGRYSYALKIIGLVSICGGFLILLNIYANPITMILGQSITLAQLHTYCGNAVVTSIFECSSIHDQFYFQWGIAVILLISGLIESILS
jgi:hypothetical protein